MDQPGHYNYSCFLLLLLCFHLQCYATPRFITPRLLMDSNSSPPPPTSQFTTIELKRVVLSLLFGVITGFLVAIFVAFTIRCFVQYLHKTPVLKGPVVFSPKIDPTSLQFALHDRHNHLLGSNPDGTYFKLALNNGLTLAVKRVESSFAFESPESETHDKAFSKKQLHQDFQVLAGLRHRHLMSFRAYMCESHRFSLVFDYMPTGSLEDAMIRVREDQLQMGWDVRLRIAVGIIKGLKFLHFDCNPTILHYNLKPSNVLLDAEFEPKLADYGLAKIMPKLYGSPNGYRAPETSHSRYTDKSDVFSFGVILGVLLTGRDPLDPFFGEAAGGGSLGRWLQHLQQAGESQQALDKSTLGHEVEQDEMLMAVRIAVACMSDLPEDRPSTDELVPMLSHLQSF